MVYAITFRGLEHLLILKSTEGPGTNSPQIPRDNLVFGESKLYADFQLGGGVGTPNPCII